MQNQLLELAYRFRRAIIKAKEAGEKGLLFDNYPNGCCGICCDIFSQYLVDNNIGPVTYYSGTYYAKDDEDTDNRQTHAWLKVDDYIIDITAEQFGLISFK